MDGERERGFLGVNIPSTAQGHMRKRERGKKRDRAKEREGERGRGREWEREKRFLHFNIPSTTLGHLRKRESKCLCALWICPLSLQLSVL